MMVLVTISPKVEAGIYGGGYGGYGGYGGHGYGHYTPIVKKVFVQPPIIKKIIPVYRPVVIKKVIPYKHHGYGGGYGGW